MTHEYVSHSSRFIDKVVIDSEFNRSLDAYINVFPDFAIGKSPGRAYEAFVYIASICGPGKMISLEELAEFGGQSGIRHIISDMSRTVEKISQSVDTTEQISLYTVPKRGIVLLPKLEVGKTYEVPTFQSDWRGYSLLGFDERLAKRRIDTVIKVLPESVSLCIEPLQEWALDKMLSHRNRYMYYRDVINEIYEYPDLVLEQAKTSEETRDKVANRPRSIVSKMKKNLNTVGIDCDVRHIAAKDLENNAYQLTKLKIADY